MPETLINESALRDAWLADRRSGIGSSDAAALLGLSPWASPWSLYLDKTGQLPSSPETPEQRWGLRLEPVLADAYTEETGRPLVRWQQLTRHPDRPWQLCTPDYRHEQERIVELKTAGAFRADDWGEPGTDEVPEYYLVQVQHQMAVTGFAVADVAVLIGGQDFRVFTVPRSEAIIDRLTEIEADFWRRVQERREPAPDWSHPSTRHLIDLIYVPMESAPTDLDDEALGLVRAYEALGARAKETKDDRDSTKAQLIHRMGHASVGRLPDGRLITRKAISVREHVVAAHQYFDFRIKTPKRKQP